MKHTPILLICSLLLITGCHPATHDAEKPQPETSISSPDGYAPQGPDVPHAVRETTDPNDHRPVIVAFGDSLTAGYGTNPGQSYPDALQHDLDAMGYHYRVVNAGISGNTTKDGVERLPAVLALDPQVVIVAFGGNDGLRGLPIEATRQNLTKIVSTLQGAGVKIVLGGITLPPNYGPDYIQQFNDTYQLLAREFHAPLLPFLLKGVYGVPGGMQEDGLHATAKGNQTVARNLIPLVTPLLKKR